MGRRYSTPVHTSKGCMPIIRLGAGRLYLASCTAYHFYISTGQDELLDHGDGDLCISAAEFDLAYFYEYHGVSKPNPEKQLSW